MKWYQARAVHAAYLIVFDRALAEDAAQPTFVKVAERIRQFDEDRPFAPWFFRIAVNDALQLAKRRKKSKCSIRQPRLGGNDASRIE